MGVEGNEKVDEAAKRGSGKARHAKMPREVHLPCICRTYNPGKEVEGSRELVLSREQQAPPLQRALHDATLESYNTDTLTISMAALVSRRYFELKSGNAVMGTYLHRSEKMETDQCWECTSQA